MRLTSNYWKSSIHFLPTIGNRDSRGFQRLEVCCSPFHPSHVTPSLSRGLQRHRTGGDASTSVGMTLERDPGRLVTPGVFPRGRRTPARPIPDSARGSSMFRLDLRCALRTLLSHDECVIQKFCFGFPFFPANTDRSAGPGRYPRKRRSPLGFSGA